MKNTLILITLVVLSLAWTSNSAVAGDPAQDCSGGCWIVTCGASTCTLWRCDSGGCREVSTFPNIERSSDSDAGAAFNAATDSETGCTTERCVVKVCGPLECSLYGLEGNRSSLLGQFDNSEARLGEVARAFLEAPHSERPDSP